VKFGDVVVERQNTMLFFCCVLWVKLKRDTRTWVIGNIWVCLSIGLSANCF